MPRMGSGAPCPRDRGDPGLSLEHDQDITFELYIAEHRRHELRGGEVSPIRASFRRHTYLGRPESRRGSVALDHLSETLEPHGHLLLG